ncbi:MAG: hypothetical protein ABF990_08060 [Acetobacter sp.]|uniref:hypothetical protein n=1 Tax=Acetobacter sp. TaxID=440 RepID=UPI0039EAC931
MASIGFHALVGSIVLAGADCLARSAGMAAAMTAPVAKAPAVADKGGIPQSPYADGTGDSEIDRLNASQLDKNYRGPYYMPGQPVPPAQAIQPPDAATRTSRALDETAPRHAAPLASPLAPPSARPLIQPSPSPLAPPFAAPAAPDRLERPVPFDEHQAPAR